MLLILNLWNDVLFCGGAIIGRPFSVPLSPPLIRLCRQLPSMGAFLPLLNIGGTKCRSGGSVGAVIGRPFYSFTLQATNGRPYFIYNHRDVEVPSPTFTFLPPLSRLCRQLPSMGAFFGAVTNYLICSAMISSTLANASSILLASLPPPCAISGLPPPRPPATAVISLIILPQ